MNEGISVLTCGLEDDKVGQPWMPRSKLLGNWTTQMSASAGSGLEID